MKSSKLTGHLAAAGAYAIFGFNIIFNKDIANSGTVSPMVMFVLRALGAAALFWALSLFLPREKVSGADLLRLALASFLGLFVPQLSFLFAIERATPVVTAVLGALCPVYTMCFAFLFLREPISFKKAGGVAMSLGGALLLILSSTHAAGTAETTPLGVVLLLVNGMSFAAYLGAFRPLISRYSVVTSMKWMFLFALLLSLPFGWDGLLHHTDFASMQPMVLWEIAYVIIFATFVAYFLIPVGQKHLRPTLVSMYSYLQPLIAAAVSIAVGMDRVTWQKALAAVLVFAGVALVSRSRAANP